MPESMIAYFLHVQHVNTNVQMYFPSDAGWEHEAGHDRDIGHDPQAGHPLHEGGHRDRSLRLSNDF